MKQILAVMGGLMLAGCATSDDMRGVPVSVAVVGDGRTWAEAACPGSFGWGDSLPMFFKTGVTVAKFKPEQIADALAAKPDFIVVGNGQGAAEAKAKVHEYSEWLVNLATQARVQKAQLIFVTPPPLRTVDPVSNKPLTNGLPADTEAYAAAMRDAAKAEGATLLDLRGALQATFKETGERANWFLHPPMDLAKEPTNNVRKHKEWRSPVPRNAAYFSENGAESLAQQVALLLKASASPLKSFLRPPDGPPSEDFKLVWSDEFDGTSWTNNWTCREVGKRKDGFNTPKNARLDGQGHLVIDITQETNGVHAAMISTDQRRAWKYGYFECRATLALEEGFWSAFWLMSNKVSLPGRGLGIVDDTINNGTEIDVMEYLKKQGDVVHMNLHWNGYTETHKSSPFDVYVPDLRKEEWHVFAVDWRADGYTFYVDGRRAWETKDAPSQTEEYVILSVEIGKWAGDIANAKLPQQVKFDWVRVWQR